MVEAATHTGPVSTWEIRLGKAPVKSLNECATALDQIELQIEAMRQLIDRMDDQRRMVADFIATMERKEKTEATP